MIFERGLEKHPKLVGMKRRLGIDEGTVFSILFRLWGHCEEAQRGMNWGKVDAEYIASVVEWDGDPMALFDALKRPAGEVVGGWIDVDKRGRVTVHGWEERNGRLLHNWNANRSGVAKGYSKEKPRKPQGVVNGAARGVQGHPAEMSRDEIRSTHTQGRAVQVNSGECAAPSGGENNAAAVGEAGCTSGTRVERVPTEEGEIPSVEEVVAAGGMGMGVEESFARDFHEQLSVTHGWIKNGRLVLWRRILKARWEQDRERWLSGAHPRSPHRKAATSGTRVERVPTEQQIWAKGKDLEREIGECVANREGGSYRPDLAESDPQRWQAELERLKKLKSELRALRRGNHE